MPDDNLSPAQLVVAGVGVGAWRPSQLVDRPASARDAGPGDDGCTMPGPCPRSGRLHLTRQRRAMLARPRDRAVAGDWIRRRLQEPGQRLPAATSRSRDLRVAVRRSHASPPGHRGSRTRGAHLHRPGWLGQLRRIGRSIFILTPSRRDYDQGRPDGPADSISEIDVFRHAGGDRSGRRHARARRRRACRRRWTASSASSATSTSVVAIGARRRSPSTVMPATGLDVTIAPTWTRPCPDDARWRADRDSCSATAGRSGPTATSGRGSDPSEQRLILARPRRAGRSRSSSTRRTDAGSRTFVDRRDADRRVVPVQVVPRPGDSLPLSPGHPR